MWDTAEITRTNTLSHDMPCSECGHATHTYLPCSDACSCVPLWVPDVVRDGRLPGRVSAGVAAPQAA